MKVLVNIELCDVFGQKQDYFRVQNFNPKPDREQEESSVGTSAQKFIQFFVFKIVKYFITCTLPNNLQKIQNREKMATTGFLSRNNE